MRFDTTELPSAEAPQSQAHEAFATELFNSTETSPDITMTAAHTNQNKIPTITDEIRNKPNGFDLCPWIPNWQIIELLEQKGLPGV